MRTYVIAGILAFVATTPALAQQTPTPTACPATHYECAPGMCCPQ